MSVEVADKLHILGSVIRSHLELERSINKSLKSAGPRLLKELKTRYTYKELDKHCGVSFVHLCNCLKGRSNLGLETYLKLLELL